MLEHAGSDVGDLTVAVIGAKGTVGRLAVHELLPHFGEMNLVGSERSGVSPLVDVAAEVLLDLSFGDDMEEISSNMFSPASACSKLVELLRAPEGSNVNIRQGLKENKGAHLLKMSQLAAEQFGAVIPIKFTTNVLDVAKETDCVFSATRDGKAFVKKGAFGLGKTFVWDVARPFDFVMGDEESEDGVTVYEGGMVRQPGKAMFGDTNIAHHPAGVSLACLSETIALCMEGVDRDYSLGTKIPYKEAKEVHKICKKHGVDYYSATACDQK